MALIAHHRFLAQEARALLSRLARVRPFVLYETMVPAAALPPAAQAAIERLLLLAKRELDARVRAFLMQLQTPTGQAATPEEAQRRFTFLRLRFNALLAQIDIFADVLTQRSEHETGVWLAGLDALAADALRLPGGYYDPPPVICYLDRGHGAAIRRARTRLPGGSSNPVAVIRVPRERMVGSGVASSLVHEVGHQAASLLDLMPSLQPVLAGLQAGATSEALAWRLLSRWLSEILADFWAVARVGIAGPMGLMAVVSLPRVFVFRISLDDPHPFPWIRVKIACAFGRALWPDPQWDGLARLWELFYPRNGLDPMRARSSRCSRRRFRPSSASSSTTVRAPCAASRWPRRCASRIARPSACGRCGRLGGARRPWPYVPRHRSPSPCWARRAPTVPCPPNARATTPPGC